MRDRFPLVVIGGLLLLAVLGSFLVKGAARGSFADTLSSWRSEPDGARALYLLAEARQLPIGRSQNDLRTIDETHNLMLLAVEFSEGSDDEQEHPSFWDPDDKAKKDDDDKPQPEQLHHGSNLFRSQSVGTKEREALLAHVRSGATLVYVPWGHTENPLLRALDVHLWQADAALGTRTLVAAQPTVWTRGVERVETQVQSYLDLPGGAVPLLLDERLNEYVAGLVPYGQGQVIIVGAPELAMNKNLALADNAQFWLSVIGAASQSGPLQLDEFHHGFTNERSIADFGRRYGLHFAALQIILGVCLWVGSLRRFGRPRQPHQDVRVGATDALFATSRLYREGRHFAHAAQAILKQLAAELAPSAGLASSKVDARALAEALRQRGRPEVSSALMETFYRAEAAKSDAELCEVASKAALVRKLMQRSAAQSAAPAPQRQQ